jgi:energy-coupling factor transporter ATP-binding protein EcfA2
VTYLDVLRQVEMPLLYVRTPDRLQRARQALADVGMGGREHALPHHLSSEQQQRVALARMLVGRPSILLAEEPTGMLDGEAAAGLLRLLLRLNAERALTVIVVTCKLELARFAPRVVTLRSGELLSDERTHPPQVPEAAQLVAPIAGIRGDARRARALRELLGALEGVHHAFVSPVTGLAYVEYLPERLTVARLTQAVEDAGYQPGDGAQRLDWRRPQRPEVAGRPQDTEGEPPALG